MIQRRSELSAILVAVMMATIPGGACGQERPPSTGGGVIDEMAQQQAQGRAGGTGAARAQPAGSGGGEGPPPGGAAVVSREQGAGGTPPAARVGGIIDLRQTHRAFDLQAPAPGQPLPGRVDYRVAPGQVYSVNMRVGMPSRISLPACEAPKGFFSGDVQFFPIRWSPGAADFVIDAKEAGLDAVLQVETQGGRWYTFYLRSGGPDAGDMPDLNVLLEDPLLCPSGRHPARPGTIMAPGFTPAMVGAEDDSVRRVGLAQEAGRQGAPSAEIDRDFARELPFDPRLVQVADITIRAPKKGDVAIAPKAAWHDTIWTYLDYRGLIRQVPLPVPFVTEAGTDRTVPWRILDEGILVIEAVAPQITLRSGDKVLCVDNRWRPPSGPVADQGGP